MCKVGELWPCPTTGDAIYTCGPGADAAALCVAAIQSSLERAASEGDFLLVLHAPDKGDK